MEETQSKISEFMKPRGVLEIIKDAWELYKKNIKLFLSVLAIVFVPYSIVRSALTVTLIPSTFEREAEKWEKLSKEMEKLSKEGKYEESLKKSMEAFSTLGKVQSSAKGFFSRLLVWIGSMLILGILFGVIALPLANGALLISACKSIEGEKIEPLSAWKILFKRLPPLIITQFIVMIAVAIGSIFFVIPGIIIALFCIFTVHVVLLENLSAIPAIKRSIFLFKSDWLKVIVVLIVFGIISFLAGFIANIFIRTSGFFGMILQDLLAMLLLPIPILGSVLIYMELRARIDKIDPQTIQNTIANLT